MNQSCAISLFIGLVAAGFSSCKKDKNEVPPKTKTELITTGSWKIISFVTNPAKDMDGDGDVETNGFEFMPPCLKDNIISFKTNGQVEINNGLLKCSASDPQVHSFNWSLTDNDTKIILDGVSNLLVSVTSVILVTRKVYVSGGVTYNEDTAFGH